MGHTLKGKKKKKERDNKISKWEKHVAMWTIHNSNYYIQWRNNGLSHRLRMTSYT